MTGSHPQDSAFTVLLVCTGNICRSALAERLGRAYLDQALGDDAGAIRLVSAGTRAVVGSRMHPDSALVLRGYGAEPGDFRAQQLTEGHVASADLTLTMTRAHRRHVLKMVPRALARTFTLREAARVLEGLGEVDRPAEGVAGERLRDLVQALARARSMRTGEDDVPDPVGLPVEEHEEAGELIVAALLPLLRRMADLVTAGPGGPVGRRVITESPQARNAGVSPTT